MANPSRGKHAWKLFDWYSELPDGSRRLSRWVSHKVRVSNVVHRTPSYDDKLSSLKQRGCGEVSLLRNRDLMATFKRSNINTGEDPGSGGTKTAKLVKP